MNSFIDSVTGMVTQVAKTSWQAAILAGLVLLFTILLRKHLSARWQAALWLVVVVRLLMPFAPESSVSLFNYFYSPIEVSWSSTPSPEIISPLSSKNEFSHVDSEEPPAHDFSKEPPQDKVVTDLAPSALPKASESIVDRPHLQLEAKSKTAFGWPPSQTGRLIIVSVWILGILVLIGHMLLVMFRLRLLLRSCDPIEDRLVHNTLEAAQKELGMHRHVKLLASPLTLGPAVTGIFRPKIILAESLLESLTANELRLIFLHELSHIRRQDLLVQQLWQLAKILHWFNPIVWIVARRWQTDRELACDEAVLVRLDSDHRTNYGHAILRVMESLSPFQTVPGAVGVLVHRDFLINRIAFILRYRPSSRKWTMLAVGLLLLLIPVGLTNAVGKSNQPTPKSPTPPTIAPSSKIMETTNIKKEDKSEPKKNATRKPAGNIKAAPSNVRLVQLRDNVTYLADLNSDNISDYKKALEKRNIRRIALPGHLTDTLFKQCVDAGLFQENLTLLLLNDCVWITNISDLPYLKNLTVLSMINCKKLKDLTPVENYKKLVSLSLPPTTTNQQLRRLREKGVLDHLVVLRMDRCTEITHLSDVANLKNLRHLLLPNCSKLTDISAIASLSSLQRIDFNYCSKLTDISAISKLKHLRSIQWISCYNLNITDLSLLSDLKALQTLRIHGTGLTDISTLGELKNLAYLRIYVRGKNKMRGFSAISNLKKLRSLDIDIPDNVTTLSFLSGLKEMKYLTLNGTGNISNASAIATLKKLKLLNIKANLIKDVSFLSDLKNLEKLKLSAANLTDLSGLAGLENLRELSVLHPKGLTNASDFSNLKNLRILFLEDCANLTDISSLAKLKELNSLTLRNCRNIKDMSALLELRRLNKLLLEGCDKS